MIIIICRHRVISGSHLRFTVIADMSFRTLCADIFAAHIRPKPKTIITRHLIEFKVRFAQLTIRRKVIAAFGQWTCTAFTIVLRSTQGIPIKSMGTFIASAKVNIFVHFFFYSRSFPNPKTLTDLQLCCANNRRIDSSPNRMSPHGHYTNMANTCRCDRVPLNFRTFEHNQIRTFRKTIHCNPSGICTARPDSI